VASVISKTIKGGTYYYLATSARVEGKPRIVEQTYLGTAAEIAAAMAGTTRLPTRTKHLAFGDLAAAWSVIEKLGVVAIVDDVVGPRRADAAVSVGTYLALAVLNRIVDPCSKHAFADWWAHTAGDRLVKVTPAALDARRYWDATRQLGPTALAEIERRIALRAVTTYELDISSLALDMTNFASYIDSTNTRASLAQRGKAKQKRFDLRLVGLGLVVTRDGGIPLVSHAYPGNKTDVTQFAAMVDELSHRHHALGGAPGALTVVFDAGQNSEPNFAKLTDAQLHYVGSLPPSDHPDLLDIPRSRYHPVATFDRLQAHETTVHALGMTHRCVLTHSEELHTGQSRGLDQTLAKAGRELDAIKDTLARGRARRSRTQLETTIDKIVNRQYMREVLTWTLTGEAAPNIRLDWHVDQTARDALENRVFGKRFLITDRHDWTIADVVAGYRSQSEAEFGFRQLKDPHVVSFSPMHHHTDAQIRVHVFCCVLALMTAHLMRREAARANLPMSVRGILDALAGIEQTVLLYPGDRGRPKARHMITDMDDTQTKLFNIFELHRWAPTS
jgi:transposase